MSTYYVLGAVGGPGEKVVNRQTSRGKIINICISDMSGDAKNNKHRRQGMRVGRGARSGWDGPCREQKGKQGVISGDRHLSSRKSRCKAL